METVHVVAINPYRKGNKGKVFSYNIDTYDKVIGSKAVSYTHLTLPTIRLV